MNNRKTYNRRSIRLKEYNYSCAGAYFVTICAQDKACLFGDIIDGGIVLNDAGEIIEKWWNELPNKFSNIKLDKYIIMPNHFHCIIQIVGANLCVRPNNDSYIKNVPDKMDHAHNGQTHRSAPTIGKIIQWFKTMSTNEYIRSIKDKRLWQRNYYEHIIRNEESLNCIRRIYPE